MPEWAHLSHREMLIFTAGLFTMWGLLWVWSKWIGDIVRRVFTLYRGY